MTIIDKAGQIRLLMSLGMRKNSIKKIFAYPGLIIGTIGTLIGILLAIILVHYKINLNFYPYLKVFTL